MCAEGDGVLGSRFLIFALALKSHRHITKRNVRWRAAENSHHELLRPVAAYDGRVKGVVLSAFLRQARVPMPPLPPVDTLGVSHVSASMHDGCNLNPIARLSDADEVFVCLLCVIHSRH